MCVCVYAKQQRKCDSIHKSITLFKFLCCSDVIPLKAFVTLCGLEAGQCRTASFIGWLIDLLQACSTGGPRLPPGHLPLYCFGCSSSWGSGLPWGFCFLWLSRGWHGTCCSGDGGLPIWAWGAVCLWRGICLCEQWNGGPHSGLVYGLYYCNPCSMQPPLM